MSGAAAVTGSALAVRDKLRGKVAQVKVRRYWPGKAPDWAGEEKTEDFGEGGAVVELDSSVRLALEDPKEDARLRRLEESRRDREEAILQRRIIRQAEIVSTKQEEEVSDRIVKVEEAEGEEDDAAIEERRRKIRERLLEKQRIEKDSNSVGEIGDEVETEEEEEEEEDSEYETDSEEEDNAVTMIKPMFVPKAERDTIAEREKIEKEENELYEALQRKKEDRKAETKLLVVEEIRKEVEWEKARTEAEGVVSDVDTDDDVNEAEEYEAWKLRELSRIKRDKEEREAFVKEREEVEKLRNMTEEERREWERKNPKEAQTTPKKKWKFMQKYYHKGAFFQNTPDDTRGTAGSDEIFKRDYSAPTGEDKFDRTVLPKVMQVKHFGRSGRTKWTHLVNEDTTQWDTPWSNNDQLRARYNAKMAGMNRPIEKPKGSKKLNDKAAEWE